MIEAARCRKASNFRASSGDDGMLNYAITGSTVIGARRTDVQRTLRHSSLPKFGENALQQIQ
jgi:hypothetical protein